MSSAIISYKNGVNIVSPEPAGLGGLAINENFKTLADAVSVFGASGTSHSPGLVPDPGSTAGTTRYLREDATWTSSPQQVRVTYDGGGSAITTGNKVWVSLPYSGTIIGYTLLADQSGSIVIAVKKCTYAGFPTTSSITGAGIPPTLSSAQKATDSTLASWTTGVSAGDILEFSVTSASTVTHVQLFITIQGA